MNGFEYVRSFLGKCCCGSSLNFTRTHTQRPSETLPCNNHSQFPGLFLLEPRMFCFFGLTTSLAVVSFWPVCPAFFALLGDAHQDGGRKAVTTFLQLSKTFLVLLLHRTCFSSDSLGIRRIRCLRSRRSAQAWQILGFPQNATFHVIEFETQGGMFCMFVAFMPKSHPSDHMQYDINLYANASSIGTAHARITVGLYTTRALNAMRPACSRVCS